MFGIVPNGVRKKMREENIDIDALTAYRCKTYVAYRRNVILHSDSIDQNRIFHSQRDNRDTADSRKNMIYLFYLSCASTHAARLRLQSVPRASLLPYYE